MKKQNLPEGARGIATASGITADPSHQTNQQGGLTVGCFRCGALIAEGSPVAWPTVGANKGRYSCPSSICGKPGPSKKAPGVSAEAIKAEEAQAGNVSLTTEQVRSLIEKTIATALVAEGHIQAPIIPPASSPSGYLRRDNFDGVIEKMIQAGERNFLFIGGTGTGKTEFAKAYAESKGLPSLICSMTIDNPIKEFLVRLEIKNGSTNRMPGKLVELFQKPSVVCFDEFNMLPPKAQSKFFELLNNKPGKPGTIFLPELGETITRDPENLFILTGNPSSEGGKYKGAEALNVAICERVQLIRAPEFTQDELIKITGCSDNDAQFIGHLRKSLEAGRFNSVVGFRLIERYIRNTGIFGLVKSLELLDDSLNYEDPRVLKTASNSAIDFYPELTGNQGGDE